MHDHKIEELTVPAELTGLRLDKFLSTNFPSHSRSFFRRLIDGGMVLRSGTACKASAIVAAGDVIGIRWPVEPQKELAPEEFPFDILYEDSDLLVMNKPNGITVHPAAGSRSGTVVNALLGKDAGFAEKLGDNERPGIVHRLDKDTSGCLIVAKNPSAKFKLSEIFARREIRKTYAALSYGHPRAQACEIRSNIGRHPVNRKKMAVLNKGGREAVTSYTLKQKGFIGGMPVSFLEVEIKTGRTHQIRVHLAAAKIPVLGDKVYGGHQKLEAPRQMLHAWKISFKHPASSEEISVEAPLPPDFMDFLKRL